MSSCSRRRSIQELLREVLRWCVARPTRSFEEVRQRAVADVGKLLWDEERVLELPPITERQELE